VTTTCSDYQSWLESQVELSPVEERDLERHLTTCADCRRVAQSMLYYEAGVLALRRITQAQTDEGTVEAIVGGAKMTSRLQPKKQRVQLEQLVNMLTEPIVRYATAALIILTLGLFGYQEVYTLHHLDRLSQTMTKRGQEIRVQTHYLWKRTQWQKQFLVTITESLSWPQVRSFFQKNMNTAPPLAWRFRFGSKPGMDNQQFWRQLMR